MVLSYSSHHSGRVQEQIENCFVQTNAGRQALKLFHSSEQLFCVIRVNIQYIVLVVLWDSVLRAQLTPCNKNNNT